MKIILWLASLLLFCNLAIAQEQSPKAKRSIQDKIKSLDKNRLYKAEYDRFEDETTVVLLLSVKDESFKLSDLIDKPSTNLYGIDFGTGFTFKGKELKEDIDEFTIHFRATSRKWRWIDERDLIAIIDGERIKFGNGKRSSEIHKGGSVYESLIWAIPRAAFEKIANAKSVEVRVGDDEITFNSKQLLRLKNFLSLATVE